MAEPLRRPLGLILSAGGALGAWQAGALSALLKEGLTFDSVLGISIGSVNGAAYCLGLFDEALERWGTLNGGILRFSPRLFPPSLCSDRPLWELTAFVDGEEEAKKRAVCRLVVVTARVRRDRPVYAVFTPGGREGWDAPLARHLVASSAVPLVFPPVKVDFRGESLTLFDGGVPCAEPMSFRELGPCRDVLVLEMVRQDEMGRPARGLVEATDQRARETVRRLNDRGVASLRSPPDPPRVFRLAPSRRLPFHMLDFSGPGLREALTLGELDAADFLRAPAARLCA